MSYILIGSDDNVKAYPFKNVRGVTLSIKGPPVLDDSVDSDSDNESSVHTATVRLSVEGVSTKTLYSETGDESVVEPAKTLYRDVLNKLISGESINLSGFDLTEPKKVAAKKTTPAKKTAPEAPTEQPSE